MSSPFHTYAGLLERSAQLIHVYLRDRAGLVGYGFWGANTVDNAYGTRWTAVSSGQGRRPCSRCLAASPSAPPPCDGRSSASSRRVGVG